MMFILSNALNSCIFLTTIISGLSLSTIIVASCIWKPMHLKSKKELEIFIKNKPYHLNYLIPKFYEDSNNEEETNNESQLEISETRTKVKSKPSLINKYIYEKTPNGYIIMNCDQDNNVFQYWSNNTIPYKILEVVARKYVLTFDCIELYIDKYYESQKKYNKLKNEINKNIELEKEKNTNTNKETNANKVTNTDVFLTSKSEKKLKVTITNDDLVCEKANKYLKKGKINEFKFTIKKKAKIKNISFLDWETIKLSMGY